jgi:putative intracellular protease/amidase
LKTFLSISKFHVKPLLHAGEDRSARGLLTPAACAGFGVFAASGLLNYSTVVNMIASDPDL